MLKDLSEFQLQCCRSQLPKPLVNYDRSAPGEVCLEWWDGSRKVTVYLTPGKPPNFIKVWGKCIYTQMHDGDIEPSGKNSFEGLMRWLSGAEPC